MPDPNANPTSRRPDRAEHDHGRLPAGASHRVARREPPEAALRELQEALTRMSYLWTRARRHGRIAAAAGVAIERAGSQLLGVLVATGEPMRLGELAARLDVEAPHVTREVRRLEEAGLVRRDADPDDRRAQQIRVTPAGRDVIDAINAAGRNAMREALAEWSDEDLAIVARLSHRMVDDFTAHGERAQLLGPAVGQGDPAAAR
ncbi:MarR family winged helix-turn-helix transcriptional regulator [Nocardia stercoris]|uniref:MarR family transcriptional regulator n=1 Tax=Nocardia stercoris TaxID=2483361 RepID=A0A3M2KZM7_9NOCA|nr:MarR family transcriptional regulator [Nocardia stercoris]RMI30919.1 MarR family transcriptional regulator [Nocardia stercoris]